MCGLLAVLLAVTAAPSSVLADDAPFPIERLIARLVTVVEADGHLSQSDLRCETVLPDTGNGSLQDCAMPEFGLQSLWIRNAASDNVSISVRLVEDPATDADMNVRADLPVRNRDALSDLGQRIGRMQVPGLDRCQVETSAGRPGSSVVLGLRNPASGSRMIVLFALSEEGLRLAETAKPGDASETVGAILVVNQLESPCVPLPE